MNFQISNPIKLFWNSIHVLSGEPLTSFLAENTHHLGYLDLVVVDFSLGSFAPHTLAKDCCEQLGLHFDVIAVDCGKGLSAQDIDRQAYGHIGRLIAQKNAAGIAQKLIENPAIKILIAIPTHDCAWKEEDIWLLNELGYLLDYTSNWVVFAKTSPSITETKNIPIDLPETPQEKRLTQNQSGFLSHFPGLLWDIDSEIAEEITRLKAMHQCWTLKDGRQFVSAGRVYAPDMLTLGLSDDAIQAIITVNPWFRFYLSPQLRKIPCRPEICRQLSNIAFVQGLERYAVAIAGWISQQHFVASDSASYQLVLMFIYFHTNQYALLVALDFDTRYLTRMQQKMIWHRKGFAYVFLERPSEGLYCFDRADEITTENEELPGLPQLLRKNIKSLALLKRNDPEGAIRLQKELEHDVKNHEAYYFHFESINVLNIGRLYMRMGLPQKALPYIRKFYTLNQGVSSDAYVNIQHHYLAAIYGLVGKPKKAFQELLKLALAWLSMDALGDLSKRRCEKIAKSTEGSDEDLVERISKTILDDLKTVSVKCNHTITHTNGAYPNFIRTKTHLSDKNRNQKHYILYTKTIPVLGAEYPVKKRMQGGDNFRELHQFVWQILQPSAHFENTQNIQTVLVSMDHGYSVSHTLKSILGEVLFYNIHGLYYEPGKIAFDDHLRRMCEDHLWVKLSDSIDHMIDHASHLELRFKRFRAIVCLTGHEATAIRKLAANKQGVALSELGMTKPQLCDLSQKNLVRILSDTSLQSLKKAVGPHPVLF